MHRIALVPFLGVLSQACATVEPGPDEVAQRYFDALAAGQYEDAWQYASAADRDAKPLATYAGEIARLEASATPPLDARLGAVEQLAEATVEVTGPDPAAMVRVLFNAIEPGDDLDPQAVLDLINEKTASGDIPRVTRRQVYTLVREADGWRVVTGWHALRTLMSADRLADGYVDAGKTDDAGRERRRAETVMARAPRPADGDDDARLESALADMLDLGPMLERMQETKQRLEELDAMVPPEPMEDYTYEPPTPPEPLDPAMLDAAIKPAGEGTYDVDATRLTDMMDRLPYQARIVPSFKNGTANGFKIFSVRPESIFARLGFSNGDVIQRVNGMEMSSPDKALEIYQSLSDADSIVIDLTRRGEPIRLTFNLFRSAGETP